MFRGLGRYPAPTFLHASLGGKSRQHLAGFRRWVFAKVLVVQRLRGGEPGVRVEGEEVGEKVKAGCGEVWEAGVGEQGDGGVCRGGRGRGGGGEGEVERLGVW